MSSIPEDLHLDILLRVPVRTTFICKCVCKNWFSIISNPDFVNLHLNQNINNNTLIFRGSTFRSSSYSRSYDIYSMSYDTLLLPASDRTDNEAAFRLDDPFNLFTHVDLLGSCNGLVCLSYGARRDRFICFWNPATKEFKKLPKSSDEDYDTFGFGYDGKTDDYKLIIMEDVEDRYIVDVYTLRTDSWRSSELHMPYKLSSLMIETGALVNGNLHWLCKKRDEYYDHLGWLICNESSYRLIISFDISDEKFKEFQLPADVLDAVHVTRSLGVLEGCLCALSVVLSSRLEIWMMQDYGVQESWARRYTITHERFTGNPYLKFIWSFKNGEILVKAAGEFGLVIYDPNDEGVREPKTFSSTFGVSVIENYVESLVSLSSYAGKTN